MADRVAQFRQCLAALVLVLTTAPSSCRGTAGDSAINGRWIFVSLLFNDTSTLSFSFLIFIISLSLSLVVCMYGICNIMLLRVQ